MQSKYINPKVLFYGAFIPNWLLKRKEVSPSAKLLYARLCQYADNQGICYPSQEILAEEIGVTRRQVVKLIQELEQHKLIEKQRIGLRCNNRYRFLSHPWIEEYSSPDVNSSSLLDVNSSSLLDVNSSSLLDVNSSSLPIVINSEVINSEVINNNNILSSVKTLDDNAIKLATFLFEKIIENNNSVKLSKQTEKQKNSTIKQWAKDIEKLIRIDKQPPSLIEKVIDFATKDDFWSSNILSGKKLREKFDTLVVQMNRKNKKKEVDDDRFSFLFTHQKTGSSIQGSTTN